MPELEPLSGAEPPVVPGEVVGWRAWVVLHGRGYREPRLRSLYFDVVWPTDDWLHADAHLYSPNSTSGLTAHGICAARDRAHLADMHRYTQRDQPRYVEGGGGGDVAVIGEVGLAGLIVPGDRGYRAERARVVSLVVPYVAWELLDALAVAYRVPARLGNVMVNPARGGQQSST